MTRIIMNKNEKFINNARKVHGDKYDYSKVEYIKAHTNLIIICPEHGEFLQTPSNHLSGKGCPKCGVITRINKKRSTTEQFIGKGNKVHENKYDYSKTEYINSNEMVIIICPEHGEFKQKPSAHLSSKGCKKCSFKKRNNTVKESMGKEFFINAPVVHNNKYDYSKVDYVDAKTKVIIGCPYHGDFPQSPSAHLRGHNCPKCVGKHQTTTDFIKKGNKVHENLYDYSKSIYVNSKTKIIIGCPYHGDFPQLPYSHLNGNGCPKCSGRFMDTEYFIEKSNKVHNGFYDYSDSVYVNSLIKIKINCPKHGEFPQKPSHHLMGHGCPRCSFEYKSKHYLPHDEMVIFIRNLNLKNVKEYFDWWKENKPEFLPKNLADYYENL